MVEQEVPALTGAPAPDTVLTLTLAVRAVLTVTVRTGPLREEVAA